MAGVTKIALSGMAADEITSRKTITPRIFVRIFVYV